MLPTFTIAASPKKPSVKRRKGRREDVAVATKAFSPMGDDPEPAGQFGAG